MLMNDLYTAVIEESDSNSLLAIIKFNEQHNIFKGHFPSQPIVPGVCMVEIVKELLQQITSKTYMLGNATQVKFLQLVKPEMQLSCSVSWKREEESINVSAAINTDRMVFKMSCKYIER